MSGVQLMGTSPASARLQWFRSFPGSATAGECECKLGVDTPWRIFVIRGPMLKLQRLGLPHPTVFMHLSRNEPCQVLWFKECGCTGIEIEASSTNLFQKPKQEVMQFEQQSASWKNSLLDLDLRWSWKFNPVDLLQIHSPQLCNLMAFSSFPVGICFTKSD